MNTATRTAAPTARAMTRDQMTDRRRFIARLRSGETSDIGWGPQCLVLGALPAATILALCEAVEALSGDPAGEFHCPVQFRAEIARCAKRHGATRPDLHVRLTDAIANAAHENTAAVAAIILAAAGE